MDHSQITTGLEVSGARVVRSLGIVRGITVRSRSMLGDLGASLQTILAMRYDANEVAEGVTEVLACGTAVVVGRA